jgi:hypothetical protein
VAGLLIAGPAPVSGQLPSSLTAEQRARIDRGEAVQLLQPVEGSPWPASTIYQVIVATPEQAAAVLSDYALQATYTPRVKSATILRQTGADVDVQYVIDIPVFADERSVSRQRVVHFPAGYRIEWNTLSDSASHGSVTHGSALFVPYTRAGREITLLVHRQTVQPASAFAKVPFVRNKAVQASVESVESIRKQVEKEVASAPQLLRSQMTRLKALAVDSSGVRDGK